MTIADGVRWLAVALALGFAAVGLRIAVTGAVPRVAGFLLRRGEIADVRALGWAYAAQGVLFGTVFAAQGMADRLPLVIGVLIGVVAVVALGGTVFYLRRAHRPR